MRILLDESLPRDLRLRLPDHEVSTVAASGWAGVENGKLLALAATRFDAFITVDRNIEFQQNLAKLPLSVIVLVTKSNRIEDLDRLVPELFDSLQTLEPRTLRKIGD